MNRGRGVKSKLGICSWGMKEGIDVFLTIPLSKRARGTLPYFFYVCSFYFFLHTRAPPALVQRSVHLSNLPNGTPRNGSSALMTRAHQKHNTNTPTSTPSPRKHERNKLMALHFSPTAPHRTCCRARCRSQNTTEQADTHSSTPSS